MALNALNSHLEHYNFINSLHASPVIIIKYPVHFNGHWSFFYLTFDGHYNDGFSYVSIEIMFLYCYIHFMAVEKTVDKPNFDENTR